MTNRLSRPGNVTKILYGVSPIGLGHATRSMAVVRELRKAGAEVRLFSGGKAAEFLNACGFEAADTVDDAGPKVVRGEMKGAASWYVRSWLAQRRNVKRAEALFDGFRPDLVVCDEEFSGMAVAESRGARRVFVSDELELGFARSWLARAIERRVERWYRRLQQSADLLIIPDEGRDQGNRRYVGPIVRPSTAGCSEVRERHGLPPGRMVLLSLSGSGAGRELVPKAVAAVSALEGGAFLAVAGNRGAPLAGERVYDLGVVPGNQDLVRCADLVITMAGKSTIDEAAAAGTPVIAIPIRHHAEQERNASALGFRPDDAERLVELVGQSIGKRGPPRTFRGEEEASRLILSLA